MKGQSLGDKYSIDELEEMYQREDELLNEVLDHIEFKRGSDRFTRPVTESERISKKRWICTVIRDIYNASSDENVRKLALEAGILAKRMTKALAEYREKEMLLNENKTDNRPGTGKEE